MAIRINYDIDKGIFIYSYDGGSDPVPVDFFKKNILGNLINGAYIIGSIQLSDSEYDPNIWEKYSAGRRLLGVDSTHLVGTTGGKDLITLMPEQVPAHTHANGSISNSGSHTHDVVKTTKFEDPTSNKSLDGYIMGAISENSRPSADGICSVDTSHNSNDEIGEGSGWHAKGAHIDASHSHRTIRSPGHTHYESIGGGTNMPINILNSYVVTNIYRKKQDDPQPEPTTDVDIASDAIVKINEIIHDIIDEVFPIGFIHMTTNDVDPGTYIGGTWKKIAGGADVRGINNNDPGVISGKSQIILATNNTPLHDHAGTLSGAGGHEHCMEYTSSDLIGAMMSCIAEDINSNSIASTATGGICSPFNNASYHGNDRVGKASWKSKGVKINANHTHTVDGVGDHTHDIALILNNRGLKEEAEPVDISNPYVAVYIYERVA